MDRWMQRQHKPRSRSRQFLNFLFFSCFASLRVGASKPPHVFAFLTKISARVECAPFFTVEARETRVEMLPEARREPASPRAGRRGRALGSRAPTERWGGGAARGPGCREESGRRPRTAELRSELTSLGVPELGVRGSGEAKIPRRRRGREMGKKNLAEGEEKGAEE